MSTNEKNVLYGGPDAPSIDPVSRSLGEILLKKFASFGNENTFIDGVTGRKISASQLRSEIIQCAKALQLQFDVKEGDVVGILVENRLEFPVILFAVLCLGATAAPMNVTYTARELLHALHLSRPRIIFTSRLVQQRVSEILPTTSFVEAVVSLDNVSSSQNCDRLTLLSDLLKQIPINQCQSFECKSINIKENIALILCSSGTTGLPKGVELTQFNVINSIALINSTFEKARLVLERITILMVIPLFHAYGLLTSLASSACGAEIVILPKFEEHTFLNAIQTYKTNIAFLVPPLLLFLAKSPLVDSYDVSSLMIVGCGAAPLSKELADAVKDRINVLSLTQGYGMSEMTLAVLSQTETHNKVGSVGALRPGTWGKIVDLESGRALGPNQRGEMCFKGSAIMKGYTRNPEATRHTIDADGWLHTGDIGYYDDDEEWFIVDRIKELIKYKGFQVPPAEIEAILLTHPDILDAAVIGIPDDKVGELPLAFVVKKTGSKLSETDVISFVAKTTSPAKRLHGGVRFVSEIPKNPSGKILRRILKDIVQQKLQSKL